MHDQILYPTALEMARRGATRGMIVRRLRTEFLDEITADLVADRALNAVAIRKRLVGAGIIGVGVIILMVALLSRRYLHVDIAIEIGMFGLMILGIGIAQLLHRTRLPTEPSDSPPRIR